jgi:hypothetical protein
VNRHDANAILDQRADQRKALIWLIISYIQLGIFAVAVMIPVVWDAVRTAPLVILPSGTMALGALLWIAFGYRRAYDKAEENISLIQRGQQRRQQFPQQPQFQH